jgi:hypothetical protein
VSSDNPFLKHPPASRHPVDVGLRSEAAITRVLVAMGHCVFLPVGQNQRYDLLVEVDGRFLRCQCKTGRLRNGAIQFNARSVRSNTKGVMMRDYVGEVDFFLIYCEATNGVYAIPMEDALRTTGNLRVTAPENNQRRRIRWAADYRLPSPAENRLAA